MSEINMFVAAPIKENCSQWFPAWFLELGHQKLQLDNVKNLDVT